jgi:pimeloyl-ACP methyl ester carboxylesterase
MQRFTLLILFVSVLSGCREDETAKPFAELTWLSATSTQANAEMPLLYIGNRESKTVLLIVHGGPGSSSLDHLGVLEKQLASDFLLAFWDQRYSGFSRFDFTRSMNISSNLEDCNMVIQSIRQKYPGKKVVLWGYDWGGAIVTGIATHPIFKRQIDGWIVVSGFVSGFEGFRSIWEYATRRSRERIAEGVASFADTIQVLNRLRPQVGRWRANNNIRMSGIAIRLVVTGEPRQPKAERDLQTARVRDIFPSLSDRERVIRNSILAVNGISFSETLYLWQPNLNEISKPGLLIWGKNDGTTPVELLNWFTSELQSKGKVFTSTVYENAWHSPFITQPSQHAADVKSFIQQLN